MRGPLKWAGGKFQLLPELRTRVPKEFGRYFEPFLGSGALFFDLCERMAYGFESRLSDTNAALVETYIAVRDKAEGVIQHLHTHARLHSEEHYYTVRAETRAQRGGPVPRAADFIYLNKTCFNGLYRVNKNGGFNVPWGKRPTYEPDEEGLRWASGALRGANLSTQPFDAIEPRKGDFVYFDPPYWPVSPTANFTAYGVDGFVEEDQRALAAFALTLKRKGVHVLLSNADVPGVRALYTAPWIVERVEARRNINSKGGSRGKVGELLIS